ncbi:MAG: N-acetylmuramoyl-L-alanine amidase [Oceanospirillaceae bacterium]|nr:N-acetylmuramoyl-L-alanine amidase [Oceanospirillaceae bacterium]
MSKPLKYLVLHCTATPAGREVTRQDLEKWHLSPPPTGRGWSRLGYSDIIHLDGSLENLTPYDTNDQVDSWEITNGVAGQNSVSRHVVYAGGVDANDVKKAKDTRTPEQLATMEVLVKYIVLRHPHILVAGHNQFAAKACPSFDVPSWLRSIGVPEANIYKP